MSNDKAEGWCNEVSEIYEFSESDEDDFSDLLIGTFFEIDQRVQALDQGEEICGADHMQLLVFGICPVCRAAL